MEFSELKFTNLQDGIQALPMFENGYGASVVKHSGSYGGPQGLYELAVIVWDDFGWDLCYSTDISSDVMGYLTEQDVTETLIKIKNLK